MVYSSTETQISLQACDPAILYRFLAIQLLLNFNQTWKNKISQHGCTGWCSSSSTAKVSAGYFSCVGSVMEFGKFTS